MSPLDADVLLKTVLSLLVATLGGVTKELCQTLWKFALWFKSENLCLPDYNSESFCYALRAERNITA